MKTIILLMCLVPTLALAEVQLNFKDKSTMCGNYALKGNQYCKPMSGGEMCWDKAEVVSIAKVDDCTVVEQGEANTANLKANQQEYKGAAASQNAKHDALYLTKEEAKKLHEEQARNPDFRH